MAYSNTYTVTGSETFTRTHARALALKVATDLYQLKMFYGHITEQNILDYVEELIVYVLGGYLEHIEYGFRRNGNWVPGAVLRYDASIALAYTTDDMPGGVRPNIDIRTASWYSFLTLNEDWNKITPQERERVRASSPVNRGSGTEPGTNGLAWVGDKTYSRNGVALQRRTLG